MMSISCCLEIAVWWGLLFIPSTNPYIVPQKKRPTKFWKICSQMRRIYSRQKMDLCGTKVVISFFSDISDIFSFTTYQLHWYLLSTCQDLTFLGYWIFFFLIFLPGILSPQLFPWWSQFPPSSLSSYVTSTEQVFLPNHIT